MGDLDQIQKEIDDGTSLDRMDCGHRALLCAAIYGQQGAVRYLIEQGVNKDAADGNGKGTPLILATTNGHLGVVRTLVELGADKEKADCKGNTPLLVAFASRHLDVARYLIEQGTDIDRTNNDVRTAHTVLLKTAAAA